MLTPVSKDLGELWMSLQTVKGKHNEREQRNNKEIVLRKTGSRHLGGFRANGRTGIDNLDGRGVGSAGLKSMCPPLSWLIPLLLLWLLLPLLGTPKGNADT
jgi:hypothetical protein